MKKQVVALFTGVFGVSAFAAHSEVVEAPVLSASPIMETRSERIPHEFCRDERVRVVERGYRSATPALLGAAVGGVIGNVLGDNSRHRDIITGAGAVLGASVGHDVGRRRSAPTAYYVTEEVCEVEYELREWEVVSGYRVRYRFGDTIYETRTDRDPGATIAVRVSHEPLPR